MSVLYIVFLLKGESCMYPPPPLCSLLESPKITLVRREEINVPDFITKTGKYKTMYNTV